MHDDIEKTCPDCKRGVALSVVKCGWCGYAFTPSRPVHNSPTKYLTLLLSTSGCFVLFCGGVLVLLIIGLISNSHTSTSNNSNLTDSPNGKVENKTSSLWYTKNQSVIKYKVSISGWMSKTEFVGTYAPIKLTIHNIGPDIKHLIVNLQGLEGMDVVLALRARKPFGHGGGTYDGKPIQASDGQAWDFGSLRHRKTASISISINPTQPGDYNISATVYAGLEDGNLPDEPLSEFSYYGTIKGNLNDSVSSSPAEKETDDSQSDSTDSQYEKTLYQKDGGDVLVFTSEEAINEANEAASAHDFVGFKQVYESGRAFHVPSGSKVIVLKQTWTGTCKIRIKSGEHTDEVGYVIMEEIR